MPASLHFRIALEAGLHLSVSGWEIEVHVCCPTENRQNRNATNNNQAWSGLFSPTTACCMWHPLATHVQTSQRGLLDWSWYGVKKLPQSCPTLKQITYLFLVINILRVWLRIRAWQAKDETSCPLTRSVCSCKGPFFSLTDSTCSLFSHHYRLDSEPLQEPFNLCSGPLGVKGSITDGPFNLSLTFLSSCCSESLLLISASQIFANSRRWLLRECCSVALLLGKCEESSLPNGLRLQQRVSAATEVENFLFLFP